MPWKDKTVEEQRREFVEAAKVSGNFSRVCREFGISRKTGYKWLERSERDEQLTDRSRVPRNTPRRIPVELEKAILEVRAQNPEWGAKKILRILENRGVRDLPCVRTVNNVLQRYGCISPEESDKRKPYIRFQRERCNELWQMDFKGDFALGNGERCYPLDIIDDCSRYCLRAEGKPNLLGTMQSLEATMREFGRPQAILSDNGAQFAGFRGGYTQLERWLMDLDVLPIHGRIMHPQTQGKVERFHRSMKAELLKHSNFFDISEAVAGLEEWRVKYNEIRPHQALGMRCPAEIYVPSSRPFLEQVLPYEYSGIFPLVKVNSWGYLRFDRFRIYLSETMADIRLEVRPIEGDRFIVCYRNFQIAEIDAATGERLNRRIYRLT